MISNKENIKDLSVIIVNYKSEHYLERCLRSLYDSIGDSISFEVIIVNNYPEETLIGIKRLFPETKIVVNERNGGFGQGNNVGARQAEGKYLLLLNPDTEIVEGSPVEVIRQLEHRPDLGAVGCGLLTENKQPQKWSAGRKNTLWSLLKNNLGFLSDRNIWESEAELEADWVAGTVLFISRKLFLELGGFDENIFMYFEDVDLCERISQSGKKIIYFPAFKVLHKCGGSYTKESKRRQKQNYYDSMVYYFKKHRPQWESLTVSTVRKIFFS